MPAYKVGCVLGDSLDWKFVEGGMSIKRVGKVAEVMRVVRSRHARLSCGRKICQRSCRGHVACHYGGCNIFENMSNDDYKYCRKRIIQCVLATDMTLHGKAFQFLKTKAQTYQIKNGQNFEKIMEDTDPVTNFNTKQEFLNILIHAADISNPTKPLDIYKQWAQRCIDEFFRQGDMEKRLGLPVSFNCDRNTVTLPQSQLGFIDAIVFPLFSLVNEFFPGLNFTIENLKKNEEYFRGIKEKADKKNVKEEIKEEEEDKNSNSDDESNSIQISKRSKSSDDESNK